MKDLMLYLEDTILLKGQGMFYGGKAMQKPGEDTSYPAIIDTGSS